MLAQNMLNDDGLKRVCVGLNLLTVIPFLGFDMAFTYF